MGRGGARVGAGRPPKSAVMALVHGSRDRGTRPVADAAAVEAAVAPVGTIELPAALPADQVEVWQALAPQALEQRTLTQATALAFRDLCEAIVVKRALLAIIQTDGYTISKVTLQMDEKGGGLQLVEPKAHPLLSQFRGMMQRVEAGLARFRLTGDGKAQGASDKPKEQTPLEKLQAQAKSMKRVK
jgi:hypothetical protein